MGLEQCLQGKTYWSCSIIKSKWLTELHRPEGYAENFLPLNPFCNVSFNPRFRIRRCR